MPEARPQEGVEEQTNEERYYKQWEEIESHLSKWRATYHWKHLLVAGDFNTRLEPNVSVDGFEITGGHIYQTRAPPTKVQKDRTCRLNEFCNTWGLRATNTWAPERTGGLMYSRDLEGCPRYQGADRFCAGQRRFPDGYLGAGPKGPWKRIGPLATLLQDLPAGGVAL